MDTWSKETVEREISVRSFVARLRFSTSKNLAQVDIYSHDDADRNLARRLEARGWKVAGSHICMPHGVVGHFYRHDRISAEYHRLTRELLLSMTASAGAAVDLARRPCVPLLPPPHHDPGNPIPAGWYDASTAPSGIWVRARSEESPRIERVAYEDTPDYQLFPWVTQDRKRRWRWDYFDYWQSEPARLQETCATKNPAAISDDGVS